MIWKYQAAEDVSRSATCFYLLVSVNVIYIDSWLRLQVWVLIGLLELVGGRVVMSRKPEKVIIS